MLLPPPVGSALPIVRTLADCVDFSKTVTPFVDQLIALPSQLVQAGADTEALKHLYLSTNPLISGFAFALAITPIFLIVSEINKNYSQVDRCWSLLPTVYNLHYDVWARLNGLPTQRLDNVLAFSVCWSIRLTFNYWRRGGYSIGSEDYRWETVRSWVNRPLFFIFNILFICIAQSVLLFTVTTPTYVLMLASRVSGQNMNTTDIIFARVLMALVLLEFFADGSQWNFHKAKHAYQKTAKVPAGWTREDLEPGFNTTGLFRYSRHPNFLGEQLIWVTLYQWGCVETSSLYNWTGVGAMSYLILFQSSTWLTEKLSAEKYPEYKIYQQRVGKFLPKLTGPGWGEYLEAQKKAPKKK
ncbi:DUF1295-domain-containing protein [Aureobasidium pullulans]|uniref:DUF1295-domain-containing protein n=1 Tax=Aureobasidium pullulans TaxID=5580 RepID=A0A4S9EBE8_AURPU|nr:DUF1295-domain-containing protein [Aureobasidium pullulans]